MPRRIVPHRLPAVPVYISLEGFCSFASMLTFTVTNVYYVTELGMTPFALVLCGTAMELAIVLFEVPTGVVADMVSRRASVVLSFLIMGTATVLFGVFEQTPLIIGAYALWGLGYTFQSGALDAWIADEAGEQRLNRVVLRASQIGSVGALLGVVVSTVLAGISLRGAIVSGGVGLVILGFVLALVMPETGFQPRSRHEDGRLRVFAATARHGYGQVRGHPVLLLMVGIALLYGAWSESFDRLWQAQFLTTTGLPGRFAEVTWIGVLTFAAFGIGILTSEVAVRRLEQTTTRGLARVLTALNGVLLVAALVFAISGSFALAAVSYLVLVACRSLVAPLSAVWVNRTITESDTRATTLSIVGQADALGQVVGGPAIGGIATAASLPAGLGLGAAILAPALLLYGRASRAHDQE